MVQKIGVVGAGQMGSGISQVFAAAEFDVVMLDVDQGRLDAGLAVIDKNLTRQLSKGKISEADKAATLSRITVTTDYAKFKDRDLVVESATENEQIKRKIFNEICAVLPADSLIASNTSSLSITRLGAATDRPGKFIGMHFMNPVPAMQLVEIIRGIATSEEAYQIVRAIILKLNKVPVTAEDFPAFIVNRILLPMINEAVYTLYEGVGSVESIDSGMKLGANHPMGPLELADFIGLDTCLAIMHVLHDGLADSKYRPCPLLVKYVEAGWLGRKTGRGFYDYSGAAPVPTR